MINLAVSRLAISCVPILLSCKFFIFEKFVLPKKTVSSKSKHANFAFLNEVVFEKVVNLKLTFSLKMTSLKRAASSKKVR